MQTFMLKNLDIIKLLEFLEEFYASLFKRVKRTPEMAFGVFIHERYFRRLPGDMTLVIVLEYESETNVATMWCMAAGGLQGMGRWEGGAYDAAERDFAIDIRKLAIEHHWKIEYGPDRKALTCPHCKAQYVYLAEDVKGSFEDSIKCQNCGKMFHAQ